MIEAIIFGYLFGAFLYIFVSMAIADIVFDAQAKTIARLVLSIPFWPIMTVIFSLLGMYKGTRYLWQTAELGSKSKNKADHEYIKAMELQMQLEDTQRELEISNQERDLAIKGLIEYHQPKKRRRR